MESYAYEKTSSQRRTVLVVCQMQCHRKVLFFIHHAESSARYLREAITDSVRKRPSSTRIYPYTGRLRYAMSSLLQLLERSHPLSCSRCRTDDVVHPQQQLGRFTRTANNCSLELVSLNDTQLAHIRDTATRTHQIQSAGRHARVMALP